MFRSHIIEQGDRVVGAAIFVAERFRFIAIDPRAEELDGSHWSSLADIERVARHLVTTGRLPAREGQAS